MIKENVKNLLAELPATNNLGEKITLVAATKTRTVEEINEAIRAGVTDIGENKAQEFRDKFDSVLPCRYHFFGRLQKNKVKYLIGKAFLIQSVDEYALAEEISRQSQAKNVVTDILLEVNLGEEQKGGIPIATVTEEYEIIKKLPAIRIKGLMAVLPDTENENFLTDCCLQMRKVYDIIKCSDDNFAYLSIGMSHDYPITIKNGANMIRVGTKIFGARSYALR